MEKDFDTWNKLKKNIDSKSIHRNLFFSEREIWWCSLGINIGIEENGKNHNSTRPVLIIKKFNSAMIWILPVTTQEGRKEHHHRIVIGNIVSWVCLSQIKTISTKRLIRKITVLSEEEFNTIISRVAGYIRRNPSI